MALLQVVDRCVMDAVAPYRGTSIHCSTPFIVAVPRYPTNTPPIPNTLVPTATMIGGTTVGTVTLVASCVAMKSGNSSLEHACGRRTSRSAMLSKEHLVAPRRAPIGQQDAAPSATLANYRTAPTHACVGAVR